MIPLLAATLSLAVSAPGADSKSEEPFAERGYYLTFMRMPTYDLACWKRIVDNIHQDRGNLLLLWIGGAFRSRKFPITWRYNQDHQNVRHDFVRELIDHAHRRRSGSCSASPPSVTTAPTRSPWNIPSSRPSARMGNQWASWASVAGVITFVPRSRQRNSSCSTGYGRCSASSIPTPMG